jgi:hypothetical protein
MQELHGILERSLRVGECHIQKLLRMLFVPFTKQFAPPPLAQGVRMDPELDASLLFRQTRQKENDCAVLLKRQMTLALTRFASFFTVHDQHLFDRSPRKGTLLGR